MGLQNRVTPYSTIERSDARGTLMGNRGVLHDGETNIVRDRTSVRGWICCLTEFRGRRRPLMDPGMYTVLFFLDEATSLAAGHRPCAACRRSDYTAFKAAWARAFGSPPSSTDIDNGLFPEMVDRLRGEPLRTARLDELPDGVMLEQEAGQAMLLWHGRLHPWTHHGYGPPLPAGEVACNNCFSFSHGPGGTDATPPARGAARPDAE
jgi:hypothetical protein